MKMEEKHEKDKYESENGEKSWTRKYESENKNGVKVWKWKEEYESENGEHKNKKYESENGEKHEGMLLSPQFIGHCLSQLFKFKTL